MGDACLICGHDRSDHPPNHFASFGWHCKVIGCSCGQFAEPAQGGDALAPQPSGLAEGHRVTGPAEATPPAPAGPPTSCQCGHTLDAHTGTGTAGHACKACQPPRHCPGWRPTTPPDLHHAIQAAADSLLNGHPSSHGGLGAVFGMASDLAEDAVEAAWGMLTQPLADLQRDLDYATRLEGPLEAWTAEQARELDRLATFEVAIRQALKPWTWSGIDADGKSYKDVVNEVAMAITALDLAREQANG